MRHATMRDYHACIARSATDSGWEDDVGVRLRSKTPGADMSLRRLARPLRISDNGALLRPLMTQEELRAHPSTDHPSGYRTDGRAPRSGGRAGAGENPRRLDHHPGLAYSAPVSQAGGHRAPGQVLR